MSGPRDSLDAASFRTDGHLPEAVYVYRDAENRAVGVSARFAPGTLDPHRKSFRLFRFEGGEWRSGLNGLPLPLYNLPDVIAAVGRSETVFLPEGEKCADLLSEWRLPSTTNACGAGKWNDSDAAHLMGADVVLLPDADLPGRRHVETIARSLHGKARSIRILELPGLGDGEDVVDWRGGGGTCEVLVELAGSAPHWTPPVSSSDGWEDPIPFGVSSEAEPYPLDSGLPEPIRKLAVAIAETIRVDPTAPAALAPAVLSAAAGNAYQIRASPAHAEPNLARYVIWPAPSGERKSSTFRAIASPLDEWQREAESVYRKKRDEASAKASFLNKLAREREKKAAKAKTEAERDGLLKEANEARGQIPEMPRRPIAYLGDVTQEALVRLMHENVGASAVLCAESRHIADGLLGRYRKDAGTDDSVFLRAHGGDRIDRARIGCTPGGEYVSIDRPSLALGICLQPDKLRHLAARPDLIHSGFLPRCNIVEPRSLVGDRIETGLEVGLDSQIAAEWAHSVQSIQRHRFGIVEPTDGSKWSPKLLFLDSEAVALRRAFANEIEERQRADGDLQDAGGFASKAAGEALRLAGLFHLDWLARNNLLSDAAVIPVSVELWRCAEVSQRWCLAESLRVLSLSVQSADERQGRRILDWASRSADGRRILAPRDLVAARLVETASEAEKDFAWLEERRWVRKVAPGKGERAQRWEVHPSAFGGLPS